MCEVNYSTGPPTELTINRSKVGELVKQSRDALAEIRRLVSRALSKMGYSKKRISTSEFPDVEKKELCIFPIEVKIISGTPAETDFTLVSPSQFPEFLAKAKSFLEFLDKNQERIQTYLSSDTVVNPLRLVPDICLLYTSPSPRDATLSRMPSSA